MMKVRMIKIVLVFLIFAFISNMAGVASAANPSHLYSINSLFIQIFPFKKGRQSEGLTGYSSLNRNVLSCVIPLKISEIKTGYDYSGTGIRKIKSVHHTRRLSNPGVAIAVTNLTPVPLKCTGTVLIQTSQPVSNNLSDIFIPPKVIV